MREKSGRNPGGQNGHKGYYRESEKEPDEIKECLPGSQCKDGGNELDLNESEVTEKGQEIEIPPIKPHVIENGSLNALVAPVAHSQSILRQSFSLVSN